MKNDTPFTCDPCHCVSLDMEASEVSLVIYKRSGEPRRYAFPALVLNDDNIKFCSNLASELNRKSRKVAW